MTSRAADPGTSTKRFESSVHRGLGYWKFETEVSQVWTSDEARKRAKSRYPPKMGKGGEPAALDGTLADLDDGEQPPPAPTPLPLTIKLGRGLVGQASASGQQRLVAHLHRVAPALSFIAFPSLAQCLKNDMTPSHAFPPSTFQQTPRVSAPSSPKTQP